MVGIYFIYKAILTERVASFKTPSIQSVPPFYRYHTAFIGVIMTLL
jgi:hypothetical protein